MSRNVTEHTIIMENVAVFHCIIAATGLLIRALIDDCEKSE